MRVKTKNFKQIRSAPKLVALEESIVERIAADCNTAAGIENGFVTGSQQGRGRAPRWRTSVVTATWEAMYYNAKVLSTEFTGIKVSVDMPKVRPAQFIRVSFAGGDRPNIVTKLPRLLIELWGKTPEDLEDMYDRAHQALEDAAGTTVAGCFIRKWGNEQGPVDFPDPDVTDMRRWQFHGDWNVSTN